MQPLNSSFISQDPNFKVKRFDNYTDEKIEKKIISIAAIQRSVNWKALDLRIAFKRMHNQVDPKFFLKKNKEVIGYAILTPRQERTWYLSQIAVHDQHQRQGHGKNLMNHIFIQARANHIDSIILDKDCTKPELDIFYKSFSSENISVELAAQKKVIITLH